MAKKPQEEEGDQAQPEIGTQRRGTDAYQVLEPSIIGRQNYKSGDVVHLTPQEARAHTDRDVRLSKVDESDQRGPDAA